MEIAGIIIAFVLMSMAKKLTNNPTQANYNKVKGFRIAERVLSIINMVMAVFMAICSIFFIVLSVQINDAISNGGYYSYELKEFFEELGAELGGAGMTTDAVFMLFNVYAVIIYVSTVLCLAAAILGFVAIGKGGKAMAAFNASAAAIPAASYGAQAYNAQPYNAQVTYNAPVQQQAPVQQAAPAEQPAPVQQTAPATAAQSASKFCTTCGNLLDAGTKFCPRCGSAQE